MAHHSVGRLCAAVLPVLLLLRLCRLAAAYPLLLPPICLQLWALTSMAGRKALPGAACAAPPDTMCPPTLFAVLKHSSLP